MKRLCNSRLKGDAYQSDFDEDDFFNFTYVFKETESFFLHSDRYKSQNSFSFFKCYFGERFNLCNETG